MAQAIQDNLWHGNIPYAVGQAAVLNIRIPGSSGLYIGLRTNDTKRRPTSTSRLSFQDSERIRHLRLDYGKNPNIHTFDFQWNHQSAYAKFRIENHTPEGRASEIAYKSARYFRWGGRLFLVAGITIDTVSIVRASSSLRPLRWFPPGRWPGAGVRGCRRRGPELPAASPPGMAVGRIGGCIIGGLGGYVGGTLLGGTVYDWAKGTFFIPLPRVAAPHE